jgi:hypothetical protein
MSDELIPKIFEKLEKISEDMGDLKVTSAKQQISLDEHIKRSNMLEDLVNHLDENKIQPIEKDLNQIKGIYKFIVFLSVLATIALTLVEFFKH